MNIVSKIHQRMFRKTLAAVLAVAMLMTGPMGIMKVYAEEVTSSAVERVDSGTPGDGSSSSEDGASSSAATPSDVPPGTSSVQYSGEPLAPLPAAAPRAASVTATVTATVGYPSVSVNLSGGTIFADQMTVEDKVNWLLEDATMTEVTTTSVSRQSDTTVRLTLQNPITPGTYTLTADTAVFAPAASENPVFNVIVHIPVPAVGTATADAGDTKIAVRLSSGGFSSTQSPNKWTLGGTSASGNLIASVFQTDGSNVTITLANVIGASDQYTLQATSDAFANVMTTPFASPLAVTVIPGDTTPPAFVSDYPSATTSSIAGSRQMGLGIKSQEPAYFDFVVVANGASAPSKEQVRAGKDASGSDALYAFHHNSKASDISTSATAPQHNTDYDIYVILRDDAGNLSEPAKADAKTPAAAQFLVASYPQTGAVQPNGSMQIQIQVQVEGTDRQGKVYWVLLPNGAAAPSIDEVGTGTASGGGAPISSGSPEFTNGIASSFLATGAADATDYDLYLVVGDTLNASPLAECTDVVKLDVTTPAAGTNAFEVVGGSQYATLSSALGAVGNNGTIKLLRTANTTDNIIFDNKSITIDLNGFDLNILSSANEGIKVTQGTLNVSGNGKLNAIGKLYGVWANNGTVTVDNAESGNDGIGVYAVVNSHITVRGNAVGQNNGVYADNTYTTVTVKGDVSSSTGQSQGAVYAQGQAEVTVEGNVTSAMGFGVETNNSGVITVNGNVSALRGGALTEGAGGSITVKGDLSSYNHGAVITKNSSGNITVDGEIKPLSGANYVLINNVAIAKAAGVSDAGKPGYLKYSGSGATGVVWVKDSVVCKIIGGEEYDSLAAALADVANGQTITLLQSITHTSPVVVNGKAITFALGSYDLTIDTSATNGSTALRAENGGSVSYTGAGKFTAIGNSTAVCADGTGSSIAVGYAETTRDSTYTVQANNQGAVTVNHTVLARGAGSEALWATGGGQITAQGNVTCAGDNSEGAYAAGANSLITITGDVTANASGTGSTGLNANNGGEVRVTGYVTASENGITVYGMPNSGRVTVNGNVTMTGIDSAGELEAISAGGGGTVTVTGNVSAAGTGCTAIYANGSTVTVTGDVDSANTGVVCTGGSGLSGLVTIDGLLTADTTYIKVGGVVKTASDDTKPSGKTGFLKYYSSSHTVYVKEVVSNVCQIGSTGYATLGEALNAAATGQTITLLQSITHTSPIVVDGKALTFALGSYDLTINTGITSSSTALKAVNGGTVNYTGTGKLSVIGNTAAVWADGSGTSITVSSAETTADTAVGVRVENDALVTVMGSIKTNGGESKGVFAVNGGEAVLQGDVLCLDGNSTALYCTGTGSSVGMTGNISATAAVSNYYTSNGADARYGATIEVTGNIWASGVCVRAYENASTATVTGDLNAIGPNGYGVSSDTGGTVTLSGNITATGGMGVYANSGTAVIHGNVSSDYSGVHATGTNATVTIDGTLTATAPLYAFYIKAGSTEKTPAQNTTPSDKTGYLKYTDGSNSVYVQGTAYVCQIEDINGDLVQKYEDLPSALTAATTGQTIRLLADSILEKTVDGGSALTISGEKELYLQMNNHNLTIRNNGTGNALKVENGAELWVGEMGNLTMDSKFTALNVFYGEFHSGGAVNAALTSSLNLGVNADHAVVEIEKGTLTGVGGGIYATSDSTISFSGPITVNGAPTASSHGVCLIGAGNSVSVNGSITIASGLGTGVYVEDGGTVAVGHVENRVSITSTGGAGIWTRQGNNTADITVYGTVTGKARAIYATGDTDIKVVGSVKSTSAEASTYAVEGFANSGDTISIAITGGVEGPSGVKYHGNSGSVTVKGNVTATGDANTAVGVYASYGTVSVTGNVAAPNGIGAEAGSEGQVTIDGVLTGNTYVRVDYVTKTESDKTLPTTKEGYRTYKDDNSVVWVKDGAPATTYSLTVQNGTGGGSYLSGAPVNIVANAPAAGKVFDKWTTDNGGSFANAVSASTTFTMPANAVTITAHWTYTGGSSGGGGGGGGSSPVPVKPTAPVSGSTNLTATTGADGTVTVSVTTQNLDEAIRAAKDEAAKKGVNPVDITVILHVVSDGKTANSIKVNLPKVLQDAVIRQGIVNTVLVVDQPAIQIGLDLAAIREINRQAGADVSLTATRMDNKALSAEAKNAMGSRPVFRLLTQSGSGKAVESFGVGRVTVGIPYTPQSYERPGNLCAVYVDKAGKVQWLTTSAYDAQTKTIRFITPHFSAFGVGYRAEASVFTDTKGHWAAEDIQFVAARGLLNGTGGNCFTPDGPMTRGMFVTALGRLAGIDSTKYKNTKFTDVPANAYHAPYVAWAAEKGIIGGTSATTFSPDRTITRQELAVLMQNYAKAMGYAIPKTREAIAFADSTSIASWATEAVKSLQMAGIINGKDGNRYDPTGTAARAEVSAVLRRFVEQVIDVQIAQGLDKNDSSSAMLYESGKLAKSGSRTVNGNTCAFNSFGEAALPTNKKTGTYIV